MTVDSQPATGPEHRQPDVRRRLEFGRNEISGAFGDLGTDLPLLVGMVLAAGLQATSVLVVFGAMQVATGLVYRIPMPVQPLKAVAVIVIAQQVAPEVIFGGGLAIGMAMLLLALTGSLAWLARVVPLAVIRGLQLGLGIHLMTLALRDYVPSDGARGLALAGVCAVIVLALLGNRRWPPAPFVVALGVAYALYFAVGPITGSSAASLALPLFRIPEWHDIAAGFVLLALPQIPLSLGNSVLATRQLAEDLFPDRPPLTVRRIGITYGVMNIVAPFLGGVPTCHGSGGLAGHYAFGGRTGGSVIIYGTMFIATGLLVGASFTDVVRILPLPMLGVLLAVEAAALMLLVRDQRQHVQTGLSIALLVAGIVVLVPYGYAVGLVVGTILHRIVGTFPHRRPTPARIFLLPQTPSAMSDLAIDIRNVVKRYEQHVAVRDLSLQVPRGTVYGLLGPNGAGKTTTIRMILSIIAPDSGTISIFGRGHMELGVTDGIGYLPEERGLYKKMEVRRVLRFLGELKGLDGRTADKRIDEWLDRLSLRTPEKDWSKSKVDELSRGMQQKVQFIAALLHDPDLVILDEPFSGLDPINAQALKDTVVELRQRGKTVIFSTHVMENAERMCDSVCIIARGEKVLDGRVADVKAEHGQRNVALTLADSTAESRNAVANVLGDRGLVARVDENNRIYEMELAPGADSQVLLRHLMGTGAGIERFELVQPSLHQIFLQRVGAAGADVAGIERGMSGHG